MDCDIKIYLYNLPWKFELRMKPQHPLGWHRVMRNRSHKDTGSTSKLAVLTEDAQNFSLSTEKKSKNGKSVYLVDFFF